MELREFDMQTLQFVKDGFRLSESKQSVAWVDADTLHVSRDFGPGSLTRSVTRAFTLSRMSSSRWFFVTV